MASRSFKKYANLGLDEEKDFFLAALNKRIRNGRKKLDQIDDLSKKDKSTLKAEQLEKINSKAEVLENMKYVDDIKELYYSSYKTAKEEGKVTQSAIEVTPITKTEVQPKAQPEIQASAQVEQVDTSAIVRDSLSKVLNLVHLVQFFRDQTHAQEFRQALQSVNLESLNELYSKIFTFSESDKFVRIEDKLTTSLSELESYVNATQQPALRNQTYEVLQSAVQRVAESSSFREHKADVSAHQKTGAEHSAIGSELKKVQEQVEAPQQAKTKSPEKVQETTKASPVKEARRDWGAVEDDEEEESLDRLREEEQQEQSFEGEGGRAVDETEKPYTTLRDKQHQAEEKKVDDGWSTVAAKHKEKRDEKQTTRGGNKPFRGGEGQRGQRRPRPEGEGERRERPEGERRERPEGEAGKTRGTRGGYRGGAGRGGYQKRDGGDEYKRKEGDVYQKKAEGTKPAEAQ